jgi:endonuclease III
MSKEEKVKLILERLYRVWPKPRTALIYKNPFELLISTILSAQATDKSVNIATPELFKKYPDPQSLSKATIKEVDKYIWNVNFHENKAKLIINCSKMLMDKFNGVVPDNMEDLDSLPGVARKTANVVLGNAFKKAEGIVVDTHVIRLTNKLGLTEQKDPVKIEVDLMKIVPKENWIDFSHLLIYFGREYCPARPHICSNCPLGDLCPDIQS